MNWAPFARRLSPESLAKGREWLQRRGLRAVLASRFTPGLRLPVYVTAGLLRTDFGRFCACLALAAALWTPLLVWLSAVLGHTALQSLHRLSWALAGSAVVFVSVRTSLRLVANAGSRRRANGILRRALRWEFWPSWATYAPVAPYLLWLVLKHRSLTVFTAANPGIETGGLVGESKIRILKALIPSGTVARFVVLKSSVSTEIRLKLVRGFLQELEQGLPVVLKPDIGERGEGVVIARTPKQLERAIRDARTDLIAQEYIAGVEFGILYCRLPGERKGRIVSITEKRLPFVVGDGKRTLAGLIDADPRASTIADVYHERHPKAAAHIPAAGERVQLVDIGSHCRGAIFCDGRRYWTNTLERRVDQVSHVFDGFYFGRFDVRAVSITELQEGKFRILELNGVSAEPAHIYDPAVSLFDAYSALFRHWRLAFDIGARNLARGCKPASLKDIIRALPDRYGWPAAISRAISSGVK